jgi:hypothetical protein
MTFRAPPCIYDRNFVNLKLKKNNFVPEISGLFAEKMVHSNFVGYKPKTLLEEYK